MSSRRSTPGREKAPATTTPSRRTASTPVSTAPTPNTSLIAVTVVLAVVSVLVAIVLLGRDSGGDGGDGGGSLAAVAAGPAPGMAHVHGLGIDPADGMLLAGTHHGTFRVGQDGDVTQVGPVQDFMGFAVVGAEHYLASGHPGVDQDGPGNVGLIESTDGGRTWETVSLSGEADFHALEARHGRVYGHSGGVLMVSDDKRTWQQRAAVPLADLAVSPDDPQTILATTEQGVAVSADDGRSFEVVPGAPVLVLVHWTDEGSIIGVDLEGVVHVSDDRGATWERRGSTQAQPAALTASDGDVFVATGHGRVVQSGDGGRTFEVRYAER